MSVRQTLRPRLANRTAAAVRTMYCLCEKLARRQGVSVCEPTARAATHVRARAKHAGRHVRACELNRRRRLGQKVALADHPRARGANKRARSELTRANMSANSEHTLCDMEHTRPRWHTRTCACELHRRRLRARTPVNQCGRVQQSCVYIALARARSHGTSVRKCARHTDARVLARARAPCARCWGARMGRSIMLGTCDHKRDDVLFTSASLPFPCPCRTEVARTGDGVMILLASLRRRTYDFRQPKSRKHHGHAYSIRITQATMIMFLPTSSTATVTAS